MWIFVSCSNFKKKGTLLLSIPLYGRIFYSSKFFSMTISKGINIVIIVWVLCIYIHVHVYKKIRLAPRTLPWSTRLRTSSHGKSFFNTCVQPCFRRLFMITQKFCWKCQKIHVHFKLFITPLLWSEAESM